MIKAPAQYDCSIPFNFQELMEVRKAITDRIVKLNLEYDYPCVYEDLAALNSIADKMELHIESAITQWENS